MIGQIRRRSGGVHGGSPTPTNPYVTDGLVFWLDGIDKGNDGNGWKELITGEVFPWITRTTKTDNGVSFANANTYMSNSNIPTFSMSDSTIEVCCSNCANRQYMVVLCQSGNGNAMFTRDSNSKMCWKTQATGNIYNINIPLTFTASANDTVAMVNFTTSTSKSNTTWNPNSNGVTSIGDRVSVGYPFVGVVHSIRIYNRKLSSSEMLANQQVDNQRFNLGLTS